jgi:hypothetical protein
LQSIQQNIAVAENAGYKVLAVNILPRQTWVEGYYEILDEILDNHILYNVVVQQLVQ